MPLIHSKSKKAMSKNIETEMHHGKPQDQAIAIAYSVKRKAAKKKASGGTVESGSPTMNMAEGGAISASNEARPSTQTEENDRHEIARQHAAKALDPKQNMTSPQNRTAARKGLNTTPIKHPKMAASDVVQARLRDEEDHLQSSAAPASPDTQPPAHDDEEGPNRQGPQHKKSRSHSTGEMMAEGGKIEASDRHHTDPNAHQDSIEHLHPSEDEGEGDAHSKNEQGPNRRGPSESSTQGKAGRKPTHGLDMYAEGGDTSKPVAQGGIDTIVPDTGFGKIIIMKQHADGGEIHHEMMEQPTEEAHEELANSIAAAIMARKRMANGGIADVSVPQHEDDSSLEEGEVDIDDNGRELPNAYYGRNEDKVLKENFDEDMMDMTQPMDSNERGDSRENATSDSHDMVSEIRKRMKSRRQMPQE